MSKLKEKWDKELLLLHKHDIDGVLLVDYVKALKREFLKEQREEIIKKLDELIENAHEKELDTYDYDLIAGNLIRWVSNEKYLMKKSS